MLRRYYLLTALALVRVNTAHATTTPLATNSTIASNTTAATPLANDTIVAIDTAITAAIADKKTPGAVILVGSATEILFCKAYGQRALLPEPEPMTTDTIFDAASLTKPIVTATAIMQLYEHGLIDLDAPACRYLPAFTSNGKDAITIRHLLQHRSGLLADNPREDYTFGKAEAFRHIYALPLKYPINSDYIYSDVGFIVLGEIVTTITGLSLDQYAQQHIFAPLGMHDTTFLPDAKLYGRIAPTENNLAGIPYRGIVHDPRAQKLGGVAGHAGMFTTAHDLARFCQMMLGTISLLAPTTIKLMITLPTDIPAGQQRGLGWDISSPHASCKGMQCSAQTYCHTGFTGTSMVIDPAQDRFLIILTSRLHPNGTGNVIALRTQLANLIFKTNTPCAP